MDRKNFLKSYEQFQLGELITESAHPDTLGLAELAQTDLAQALDVLKKADIRALEIFLGHADKLTPLRHSVQNCLAKGGRIFIGGCGATGRLALLLESIWRKTAGCDEVVAFMAGGDVALVHSLEGFEDFPQHGARHLKELGFTAQDLFIGVTEGGETPYVIGATEAAAAISTNPTYFLFCNPQDMLKKKVERSKKIIEDKRITKIDLTIGPMALSGSTRMQASSVLQLAVGFALFVESAVSPLKFIADFIRSYQDIPVRSIEPLIQKEMEIYRQKEFVMYVPHSMALTVFTDTTERSPTFSLPPFESSFSEETSSLSYVLLPEANDFLQAWQVLLGRRPRPLNWQEIGYHTTEAYLESFDFSKHALEQREKRLRAQRQHLFEITERQAMLHFTLGGVEVDLQWGDPSLLVRNTLLKMLLNIHSTLLMGLMGRFESNVMTWVRPSNAKLVDRAARYSQRLLSERGVHVNYLDVVNKIFDLKQAQGVRPFKERSLVGMVCDHFVRDKKKDLK